MNLTDRDERTASAGEYVLGTLSAEERQAFEAALVNDAGLQAETAYWQDRLLPLAHHVGTAAPAAGLWSRIEARLPASRARDEVDGLAVEAANDSLWRRLRVWQGVSALATAAALVMGVMLSEQVERDARGAVAPRYLAVLEAPDDKRNGWLVEATAGGRLRLVPIVPPEAVPAGKALQFWTKAEGAAGPTSLGLVQPGQVVELPVERMPTLGARQLFELTLEPEAGSPIGRPTGPILYLGRTVQL
ncbi:anti-sigma factor [Aquariibacter lacus]|nr:anti-sigma factor [Piscinibacter lacus]